MGSSPKTFLALHSRLAVQVKYQVYQPVTEVEDRLDDLTSLVRQNLLGTELWFLDLDFLDDFRSDILVKLVISTRAAS